MQCDRGQSDYQSEPPKAATEINARRSVNRAPDPVVCQNSAERLRGPLVVVVRHPAEPFATLDASSHVDSASLIVDQLDADPLMIPLDVVKISMPCYLTVSDYATTGSTERLRLLDPSRI